MSAIARGFRALVATQALSAFNHNLLRSALLTLVAFRPVEHAGMTSETVIALSTLSMVAPYAVLSLPAGRLADRFGKTQLLRWIKAFEIAVFSIAGAGLVLMNVPILLIAVLLAGIEAALIGPAKFAILPELLPKEDLISGNAWVSGSSTIAILAGLIAGNLLVLSDAGIVVAAGGGIALAVSGWALTLRIAATAPRAPHLETNPRAFVADFRTCFHRLAETPALVLPVIGCSWFWFQGAVNTSLMPLYVAQTPTLPESVVSILLITSSIGIAVGAAGAHFLARRPLSRFLPAAVLAVIALPGIDLWLGGPIAGTAGLMRSAFDFFVLAAGCGLYAVPLATAVQQLTPDGERARFIGINHTANGLAMMCSGLVILLLNLPGTAVETVFAISALVSGLFGALTLMSTMPELARSRQISA